jgi:glycosyltransferase involved in cell wall biosynthesis
MTKENLNENIKEGTPLVSIIVITYNSAKYVLETLESTKSQTYQNIELIISDDGSSDNTVEICQRWIDNNKERFVGIEFITILKNTGIPANCNRGIIAAKGEWVKIIAGDDALMDNCIEENINFYKRNPEANLIQTNVEYYKDSFIQESFLRTSKIEENKLFGKFDTADQQYQLIIRGNQIIAPSMFIKKCLYSQVGLYDEGIPLVEDLPFWTRVLKKGYKIHFFKTATVKYRIHSESAAKGGGEVMSKQYAKNLLVYSKKYKRGNVSWIHYNIYNFSLKATIIYHRIGVAGLSSSFDGFFSSLMAYIRKL